MTYVIAQPCIGQKEKTCIDVCPVDCIHEVDQMLVIDPVECIDCAACESECPVQAIFLDDSLPEEWQHFAGINAAWNESADKVNDLVAQIASDT